MKSLILATVFYACSLHAASLVEDPEQCLKKAAHPCAIKNILNKPYQLQLENVEISLNPQGVVLVSEDSIRIVRGEVLLTVKKAQKFETAYARVEMQEGVALIRVFDSMEIDLIDGSGQMWLHGDDVAQDMTPGFHWNVEGVSRRGIASVGVPQSSVFKTVVKSWAYLNFANKEEFFEKVEAYRLKLVSAVGQSSSLNQNLARKMVEEDEAKKRNAARVKAQVEAENKQLRSLYRRKNNMD